MNRIKEAIDTGHKASTVLKEIIEELATMPCPTTHLYKFSYQVCDKCLICKAKKLMEEK